ncbi:MAG: integrase arm-type DNA-binding domain-containing protein, partial [Desulfovibrio sp.]|nr:integrase arm-type DNA-binding domain-containing protein [Desulfovibrio sp.]
MLTEKVVLQAKPKENLYRISDNIRNGLSLEVSPEGGKRWRFRYRFNGKAKMISLGTYPLVPLVEARDLAKDARKEIARGVDPSAKRKTEKSLENSFRVIAKEWFDRFAVSFTKRYAAEVWARLERDVFPFLGDTPLAKIDASAVLSVLRRTEDRGVIITTHKIKSHISQIFKYAIACGLAYTDPSRDLSAALTKKAPKPMAAIIDPREVGKLMLTINGYAGTVVRSALLLGALTFVRPGELRTAEWSEFDMEDAEWRIPAHKMKMKRPHIVPLSTQALAVLEMLRPLTGHGTFLFPSIRTGARPMSDATVNAALRSLGYAKETMTGHGFRAMASSL